MQRISLIIFLLSTVISFPVHAEGEPISTRFGQLSWSSAGKLQYRNATLPVEYGLGWPKPLATLPMADSDVIFLQQSQGNTCPGLFVFITVTKAWAKATAPFGTCYDDLPEAASNGQEIVVEMEGADGLVTYVYRAGVVTIRPTR